MAFSDLNVWIHLDKLHCFDENDGWGDAEPYLWAVFFKIDGETCHVDSNGQLQGTASVVTGPGGHGNLGDTDVGEGDDVSIPSAVGSFHTTLRPIPVDVPGIDPLAATCGVALVLMEEDNVPDHGAEAGHTAMRDALQSQLDQLITTLNFSHQVPTPEEIEAIKQAVKDAAKSAVKNSLSFFESIWAWLNSDDEIGDSVDMFSHADFFDDSGNLVPHKDLDHRFTGDDGDWEITGAVEANPPCPTTLFTRVLGAGASSPMEKLMREFRDHQLAQHREILPWWSILSRATPQLTRLIDTDAAAKNAAAALIQATPALLAHPDQQLPDALLAHARELFEKLHRVRERRTRMGAARILSMLPHLTGKSVQDAFATLGEIRPARYPRKPDGSRHPRKKKTKP